MNFRYGSGKKVVLVQKLPLKKEEKKKKKDKKKKEKKKKIFCKTILLAVRRQSVKNTGKNKERK